MKNLSPIRDNKDITTKEYVDNGLVQKQNSLPIPVKGKYLHSNATTGELEWEEAQGGGTITDVTQNGVSVVTDGVAEIDAYTQAETDSAIYNAIGLAIESSYPTGGEVSE